jgi:hypothetical protein
MSIRREPWILMVSTFSSAGQPSPTGSRAAPHPLRATAVPERALRALRATWCRATWVGPVAHRQSEPHWPGRVTTIGMGRMAAFGPLARAKIRIPFLFSFGLNSSLKFENSYLPVQSSKNHETDSIGFINSRSIQ